MMPVSTSVETREGRRGMTTGDFFRKWLFSYDECEGYKIVADGGIVGGMLIGWPKITTIRGVTFSSTRSGKTKALVRGMAVYREALSGR